MSYYKSKSNGPSVIDNIEDVLTKTDSKRSHRRGFKNGVNKKAVKQQGSSFHQKKMKKISSPSHDHGKARTRNKDSISQKLNHDVSPSSPSPSSSSSSSEMSQSKNEIKVMKILTRIEGKVQKTSYLNMTNMRKQKKGIKMIQELKSQLLKVEHEDVHHSLYGDILTRLQTMRDNVKSNSKLNNKHSSCGDSHPLCRELSNVLDYWLRLNITSEDENDECDCEESMDYLPDYEEDDEVTETTAECTSTISSSASIVTRNSIVSQGSNDSISLLITEGKSIDPTPNDDRPIPNINDAIEKKEDKADCPTSTPNVDSDDGLSEESSSDNGDDEEEEEGDTDLSEDEEKEGDEDLLKPTASSPCSPSFKSPIMSQSESISKTYTNSHSSSFDLDFDSCLTVGILEAVMEDSDYCSDSDSDNDNHEEGENNDSKKFVEQPKRVTFKDAKPSAQDALARARALLENARSMQQNMA